MAKILNANGACGHCYLDPTSGKNEDCNSKYCFDSGNYDPQAVLDQAKIEEAMGANVSRVAVDRARRVLADRAIAGRELTSELSAAPPSC